MSENYKKYLDKAKKKSSDNSSAKEKQDKEYSDLYKKFNLKYAMGTPSVASPVTVAIPSMSANTSSSLSPLLKNTYSNHLKHLKKFSDGGQVKDSQQKEYQAKEYFGKDSYGDNGPASGMSKGGQVQHYDQGTTNASAPDKRKSFYESLKDAFDAPTPPPQPTPEEARDAKYARIRKENTERFSGQGADYQGYSDGTSNAQTPYEAGIEAKARRAAVLRAAGLSDEQTPEEVQIEAEEKRRRELEPQHYTDGSSNVSDDDLQAKAKKYGWTSEHVAYLKSLRSDIPQAQAPTQQPTPTLMPSGTDQGIHLDPSAAQNVAQAFANGGMVKSHSDLYKSFLNLYGGLPKVPKLQNPLAAVHAPAERKVPLNIPRGAKIHFPKRLKPVGDVTGFAEGTQAVESTNPTAEQMATLDPSKFTPENNPGVAMAMGMSGGVNNLGSKIAQGLAHAGSAMGSSSVHDAIEALEQMKESEVDPSRLAQLDKKIGALKATAQPLPKKYADGTANVQPSSNNMDLGDIPIAPSTPYPGEEEDALNKADSSTQGQVQKLIDEHNDSKDVLQQIDQALGNDVDPKEYEKIDASKLHRRALLPMSDEGESSDDQHDKAEQEAEDKALVYKLGKEDNEALKSSDATTEAQLDKEDTSAADEDKKEKPASKEEEQERKEEVPSENNEVKDNGPMQQLADAQEAQRKNIFINQVGAATDRMAGAMGNFRPINEKGYEVGLANADLPVKQLEQKISIEKYDPNSETSQSFRKYLTKFGGQDVADLGNISAAQAESIAPMAFKQFEAQQAQAARSQDLASRNQERLQQMKMLTDQRSEAAKDRNAMLQMTMEQKRQAQEQAAKDKAEQKAENDRNKAFMKTSADLEQMRGSPAVSQAEKDIYASQKADSLAGLYPDPNKLSPTQVRLLATEVSKVASGGAPTMEELKGVTPDTFRGKLAGVVQKLTNSPSPANAGDFIKQYQDYTKALTKDAQKVIMDRYGRIIEPRKKLLGDDHYQDLQDSYINRFKNVANPSQKEQSQEGKTVVRKGYNPSTNQTQLIYNDGTKEIVDGKQ